MSDDELYEQACKCMQNYEKEHNTDVYGRKIVILHVKPEKCEEDIQR